MILKIKYPHGEPVFLVAGSAGSLEAFRYFASHLPKEFPSPVVFLAHHKRSSHRKVDLFFNIIKSVSNIEVVVPQQGELLRSNKIYLPKTDKHITIVDNFFNYKDEPLDSIWCPSIDVLFKSVVRNYEKSTVAVLLSGLLNDGVEGLKEVTLKGGLAIAQAPTDALKPDLPLNAIYYAHPDYVLPYKKMPSLFCELAGLNSFPLQKEVIQEAAINAYLEKRIICP